MQVRYLNLPTIPLDLIQEEISILKSNTDPSNRVFPNYKWTSASKTKIENWCNANISENLVWGLQVMSGDLILHVDAPTKIKISYIIETGGNNVITEFYKDFEIKPENLLDKICIEPFRWHILNVNTPHRIIGVDQGKTRISLTGRIF